MPSATEQPVRFELYSLGKFIGRYTVADATAIWFTGTIWAFIEREELH